MKIAYIVSHKFCNKEGVSQKIIEQVRAWKYYGAYVRLYAIGRVEEGFAIPDHVDFYHFYIKNVLKRRLMIDRKLIEEISHYNPDILYIRYDFWSLSYDFLLKKFKSIIEIQTNDIYEFKLYRGVKQRLKYLYFRLFRDRFLSNATAFITVTKELSLEPEYTKYGKPIIYIPNGIELNNYPVIKRQNSDKVKKVFFIGTYNYPWHGVDLIQEIALKLPQYEFHIIGPSLKDEHNIISYGTLTRDEYIKILNKCHICIGTLALHRNKMTEACPIKVREYLAYGFPVVIGYKDTAFLENIPDFICTVDFSDEKITDEKVGAIKDFVERKWDRIVLHEEIEHLDTLHLEKKRLEFFNSLL